MKKRGSRQCSKRLPQRNPNSPRHHYLQSLTVSPKRAREGHCQEGIQVNFCFRVARNSPFLISPWPCRASLISPDHLNAVTAKSRRLVPPPTTQTLNLEMRVVRTTNVRSKGTAASIVSTMIAGFLRITLHAIAEDHLGLALDGLLRHILENLCINAQRVLVITTTKHVMRMGMRERSKRRIFRNGFVMGSYRNAVSFPCSLRVTRGVNDGAYVVSRTFKFSFSPWELFNTRVFVSEVRKQT